MPINPYYELVPDGPLAGVREIRQHTMADRIQSTEPALELADLYYRYTDKNYDASPGTRLFNNYDNFCSLNYQFETIKTIYNNCLIYQNSLHHVLGDWFNDDVLDTGKWDVITGNWYLQDGSLRCVDKNSRIEFKPHVSGDIFAFRTCLNNAFSANLFITVNNYTIEFTGEEFYPRSGVYNGSDLTGYFLLLDYFTTLPKIKHPVINVYKSTHLMYKITPLPWVWQRQETLIGYQTPTPTLGYGVYYPMPTGYDFSILTDQIILDFYYDYKRKTVQFGLNCLFDYNNSDVLPSATVYYDNSLYTVKWQSFLFPLKIDEQSDFYTIGFNTGTENFGRSYVDPFFFIHTDTVLNYYTAGYYMDIYPFVSENGTPLNTTIKIPLSIPITNIVDGGIDSVTPFIYSRETQSYQYIDLGLTRIRNPNLVPLVSRNMILNGFYNGLSVDNIGIASGICEGNPQYDYTSGVYSIYPMPMFGSYYNFVNGVSRQISTTKTLTMPSPTKSGIYYIHLNNTDNLEYNSDIDFTKTSLGKVLRGKTYEVNDLGFSTFNQSTMTFIGSGFCGTSLFDFSIDNLYRLTFSLRPSGYGFLTYCQSGTIPDFHYKTENLVLSKRLTVNPERFLVYYAGDWDYNVNEDVSYKQQGWAGTQYSANGQLTSYSESRSKYLIDKRDFGLLTSGHAYDVGIPIASAIWDGRTVSGVDLRHNIIGLAYGSPLGNPQVYWDENNTSISVKSPTNDCFYWYNYSGVLYKKYCDTIKLNFSPNILQENSHEVYYVYYNQSGLIQASSGFYQPVWWHDGEIIPEFNEPFYSGIHPAHRIARVCRTDIDHFTPIISLGVELP
jgi:hypothetical protein